MTNLLSPSHALSAQLVSRLVKAGLLRADKTEVLIEKIATGSMKGQDWRLEVDLAQGKAAPK